MFTQSLFVLVLQAERARSMGAIVYCVGVKEFNQTQVGFSFGFCSPNSGPRTRAGHFLVTKQKAKSLPDLGTKKLEKHSIFHTNVEYKSEDVISVFLSWPL